MFLTKKRLLLSVFILVFALFLSGCGKNNADNQNTNDNNIMDKSQEIDSNQASDENEKVLDNNQENEQTETSENNQTNQKTTIVDTVFWRVFENKEHAYTVSYPGICNISGDLKNSVDFTGPLEDNEWWPKITINHNNSEFYRPPAGTDVKEWVKKFPAFENGSDTTIDGLPTVHFVQSRTPQSYAADYYYFIKDSQLYQIVILHTGDRTDWPVYDKFLNSFSFVEENKISETSCQTDADCVPVPACHPQSCINSNFVDNYEKPEICTLQYDCQAAYNAEDCLCQENVCINKNENSLCLQ